MVAPVTVFLAGVAKTSLLRVDDELEVVEDLQGTNTAKFNLIDPSGAYTPDERASVALKYSGTTFYGGVIVDVVKTTETGSDAVSQVESVDYSILPHRYLVARTFEGAEVTGAMVGVDSMGAFMATYVTGQTCGQIVASLCETEMAAEGISAANVDDGPIITKAVFNWRTCAEALDELAELAGFSWWIDENKALYFTDSAANAAPFAITIGGGSSNVLYEPRPAYRKDRTNYRNRQYVRGGNGLTGYITESAKGNGASQTFPCRFPLAEPPTVTVNGSAKSVGIRGVDTGREWYWQKNETNVSQDDGGTPITSSDTIAVTYRGFYPIVTVSQLDSEITGTATQEGTAGVVEAVLDDPQIESTEASQDRSQALLRRLGARPGVLTFSTLVMSPSRLRAGQIVTVTWALHGLSAASFLITKVRITFPQGMIARYDVEAVEGEIRGGWERYLKRLQAGKGAAIRENEVVLRIQANTETAILTDTLGIVVA